MNLSTRAVVLLAIALVGILPSLGCGPQAAKGVNVTVTIHKEGKPLQVPNMDIGIGMIEVVMLPAGGGEEYAELADETGTVTFAAGLEPGKYKMAVFQRDEGMESDKLDGAFSRDKTKIEIDVPDQRGEDITLPKIELNDYLE